MKPPDYRAHKTIRACSVDMEDEQCATFKLSYNFRHVLDVSRQATEECEQGTKDDIKPADGYRPDGDVHLIVQSTLYNTEQ